MGKCLLPVCVAPEIKKGSRSENFKKEALEEI
jgi:hypothetical protein